MSTIDDVKARLDIVEVVAGYLPELKKAGRTWKARCPFHNERTPSFVVDPERQTWHCFGACSTGGDVIEFVRRREGLDFKEALRLTAERAGVELRPPSKRDLEEREQHERLLAANEAAAVFYQALIEGPQGAEARAYAESRGLDAPTRERWQIGFAPDGWSSLIDHMGTRGFSNADLVAAGLAVEGERGAYDRFRYRLMFPTRDARRRLIGFGARAIRAGDEPKYLNTPQTPLFDKSANLYGLDRAADAIRRADRAVVVEGYMDVIAAHQFDVENVVASNGTSITEKQMALLKRYTHNVVLALDADNAGSTATLRGVEVAAGVADRSTVATVDWRGLVTYQDVLEADIRVVSLPAGEDPDSLVRRDPEALKALIEQARPVADHLFQAVGDATDAGDARARSKAMQVLLPTVAAMADPVVRAHYVQRLARLGQVDESVVTQMLRGKGAVPRARPVATSKEVQAARRQPATATDGESQLLQLLVQRREARGSGLALDAGTFEDSLNRAVFEAWAADIDIDERLDELEPDVRERYEAMQAIPLPAYEPRHVGPMVQAMARELRLRRQGQRLRNVAVEQARSVQAARLGAAAEEAAAATDDVAEEFDETTQRQRALAREYQVATGHRPAEDAGGNAE